MVSPALLAFEHPTVGSMLKGRGVGAPSSMHCMKRPSRQPSAKIQSAVDVAAVIRITVIKQHVKAITCNGAGIRHGHNGKYIYVWVRVSRTDILPKHFLFLLI